MHQLVRYTLKHTVFFNLVFVLLMVAGAFSVMELPIERYPEVRFGKATITTVYPGASPQDVEALITRKIEIALEGMQDIEFTRSTSAREISSILVKFRDDTDYEALYDELRFRVLGDLKELPDGIDPPRFELVSIASWLPVVSVNLLGSRSNRALTLMAEELKVPMAKIPGIKDVEIEGEFTREFHIYLDPERMAGRGITFDAVAQALTAANLSLPAGSASDASGELVVVVDERFRSRAQVVSTVIRRDADGSFVTLADVISAAHLGYRDPTVISSLDGEDAVTLKILKTTEGNALEIKRRLDDLMTEFAPILEKERVRAAITQDSTVYIRESLSTLGWNLIVGMVLVSAIIWYFMGWRNAGLVTIGVPFSFLVTMVMMHLSGNSLNEITLFAFVLVSGIIVDDAIVVVENIYRHIQNGRPIGDALVEGTAEVMMPVISSTLTTVAAFLPMLLMSGSTGEFFAEIPRAVSFAIIASLLECLLILPLHYRDFGPRRGQAQAESKDNLVMRGLRAVTEFLIRITMRHRGLSLTAVVAAFCAAIAVLGLSISGAVPLIPIKFFPDHYKFYYAFIEGPPKTSLSTIDDRTRELARFIVADGPGYAASAIGYAGIYINQDYEVVFSHNQGTVMVTLPAEDIQAITDPVAHLEQMRKRITERFQRNGYRVEIRAEQDGPPSGKDISIRVLGTDNRAVSKLAAAMLDGLRNNNELAPHLTQLEDDRGQPSRTLYLAVNQLRAQEYGLTTGKVAHLAASVLNGRYIGKYRLADEEVDLKLRVDTSDFSIPEQALDMPLLEDAAGPVRLGELVRPSVRLEPRELHRYQANRAITITGNIVAGAPVSSASVVAWARHYYQGIADRYPGATVTFGGEYEDTQRSYTSLAYAFGLAVLIIYLILASQFHSYVQPLIILSAVVFSIIGVVFGKLVTQSLFTVNSFIAVVGVTGVVVNDSLVLIDFINHAYLAGISRAEAIREGIRVRLRPIVLTTLTTTLGLLPMAIGFPSYSVVWGTMASTFVTGLATATFLTLFIVPVEWDLLMEAKERLARRQGVVNETD